MKERDCANCKHHTSDGCSSWDCEFEAKDLISRADAMAEFREWVKRANENGETPTWNDAVSLIGSIPSADYSKPLQTTLNGELISRADAIEAVHTYFRTQLAESGGEWNDELQEYVFSKEDKRLLSYNKGVSTAIKALPSAEAVEVVRCKDCKHKYV